MIKLVRFSPGGEGAAGLAPAWRTGLAEAMTGTAGVRPVRAVLCVAVHGPGTGPVPHGLVAIEWYRDRDHLGRGRPAAGPAPPGQVGVLVAEELIGRGGAWLARRWVEGGTRLKQMAVASRAPHLSREEFSTAWKARAGTVGGAAGRPVTIPLEARGRAYVQNHPVAGEWAYDAFNEVYFDTEAELLARVRWFEGGGGAGREADLFSRSAFMAAEEHLVP